jgi:serine/threonine protein kinase
MSWLERGMMVGPYELIGQHWEGALQNVWVARRPEDKKQLYALRILDETQDGARDQLLAWGCAMGQMHDPMMSRTVDLVFEGELTAVVSELVIGESLRHVSRIVHGLSPVLALSAVQQLAGAVQRLYALRTQDGQPLHLRHGCIDAHHVMFDYDRPRLVLVEPGLEALTQGQTSHGDDVYGLGQVLWEMLAGRVAPVGEPGARRGPKFPSLSSMRIKTDKALNTLVQCAVASNPSDRYTSLEAFVNDLDKCLKALKGPLNVEAALGRILSQRLQHRRHAVQTLVSRWTRTRRPRTQTCDLQAPTPPLAPTDALQAAPFVEPGFADTQDMLAATSDLPVPKPAVLQAFRQLTWLGVLAIVALCAAAYASTSGGQASWALMMNLLFGPLG